MENAGGSQVPRCVVEAVREHLTSHCAQLSAGYGRSNRSSQIVRDAHAWLELFMNAQGQGQVVIGSSTSQLALNLAYLFGESGFIGAGDNVVLQQASHESVVGPWVRLAARVPAVSAGPAAAGGGGGGGGCGDGSGGGGRGGGGCAVRWWGADPATGASHTGQLEGLLDGRTRLVVLTHVSNLLGDVLDLPAVVRLVRQRAPQAQVVVDGVAYAPHRAMDVSGWDVDWYLYSPYKVYGPHLGVMYGKQSAYAALVAAGGAADCGPNHYFVDKHELTYKMELGGASHEGCAGLLALQDYLLHLLQHQPQPTQPPPPPPTEATAGAATTAGPAASSPLLGGVRMTRQQVEAAFQLMAALEQPLTERLVAYLAAHPAVRLVGSPDTAPGVRVPTVSFVHRRKSSAVLAAELQEAGFAVRCGHMYARRLVEALADASRGGLLAAEAAERQRHGATAAAAAGGGASAGAGAAGFDVQRAVDEGVVRVSLLHYNTPDEVERLVAALQRLL
ncbi:hypothetical protein HYH02_003993 [Chlamydomonas schloesseri]|uniref:Aminotransferase class V domain-containing protein n=1 Tax=Chlamydomonas schloesseri TaxID=2026947 RepID=A0A835WPC2_9CHLO|nr:hypothetical protein HYH02_003993 [Chlamydomonas schloesseri]|eukprot:KAG2451392.1 hypothetical protein HYH02_003993 [Chlamydomonas schloesseri]